ncbi:MAG: hypothetical protein FJZ59_07775 [Chlamydiae bacterium]|nr:hypothetical protein [Chlamydiota bacterium]
MNDIRNQNLDRYENFAVETTDETAKIRGGMFSGKLETEGNFFGRIIQYLFGGGRSATVKDFTATLQQKYGITISDCTNFQQLQQEAIGGGLTPKLIKSMALIAQEAKKDKELKIQKIKSAHGETVLGVFTLANAPDRSGIVRQKKATYQQELKNLSSNQSDRAAWCEKMIALLDKASAYQVKINKALLTFSADFSSKTPGYQQAERLIKLENFRKVNDRPNKLELHIEEIEQEKKILTLYQNKLEEVEAKLAIAEPGSIDSQHTLILRYQKLTRAIEHQQTLIEDQIAFADYIRPPFEKMDEATQKTKEERKWKINAEKARAQAEHVASETWLFLGLEQNSKRLYLNNQSTAFFKIAIEAEKTNPNQEIISRYLRSAELHEQAVKAFDEGKVDQATYLNKAGSALQKACEEAKKTNPNQEVISRYLRSAELHEQAVKAFDEGKVDQVTYLNNAGSALQKACEEAQKAKPKQEIISRYLRSAELHEQAVKAFDEGKVDQATYLNNAGSAFFNASKEDSIDSWVSYRQEIIHNYCLSAELYEQAAKAFPNEKIVNRYLRIARLYERAAEAFNKYDLNGGNNLNKAGAAFQRALEASQKSHPNRDFIVLHLLRSARLYEQAGKPQITTTRRMYLNAASEYLQKASEELQKAKPDQLKVDMSLSSAKNYEKTASLA